MRSLAVAAVLAAQAPDATRFITARDGTRIACPTLSKDPDRP